MCPVEMHSDPSSMLPLVGILETLTVISFWIVLESAQGWDERAKENEVRAQRRESNKVGTSRHRTSINS